MWGAVRIRSSRAPCAQAGHNSAAFRPTRPAARAFVPTTAFHTSASTLIGRNPNFYSVRDQFQWRKVRQDVFQTFPKPPPDQPIKDVTFIPETHPDEVVVTQVEKEDFPNVPIGFGSSELNEKKFIEPKPRPLRRNGLGGAAAVGRRKSAGAVAVLTPGTGKIVINGRNWMSYFKNWVSRNQVLEPLTVTERLTEFDVKIKVGGGGFNGQAGAIRLAITRALLKYDPELYLPLRSVGFLTRDPREVERKKPGRRKARRSFQWVKR